MRTQLLLAAAAALLVLAVPAAVSHPATSANNGIVMMVHGDFEPWTPTDFPPPAAEALATTVDDGMINLHVIPYSVDGEVPVVVDTPTLRITPVGGDAWNPTLDARGTGHTCEMETNLTGHEGLAEACLVYHIPADEFTGENAVLFDLYFTLDGDAMMETYNSPAHLAIHGAMEGGPTSFQQADALTGEPTPYLVENLVDPVP